MDMPQYKWLFFDLDRTLWDYEANSLAAFEEILIKLKLDTKISDPGEFKQVYDYHNSELWEKYNKGIITKDFLSSKRFEIVLKEFGIEDSKLVTQFANDYLSIVPTKKYLVDGCLKTLEYLSDKGYDLNIITNGFKEIQYLKLKSSGIDHLFSNVFISEEIGSKKPHPGIFEYALKMTNASKENSLMIGDDIEADIAGAKDFGIDQVFFNPQNLIGNVISKPTYMISQISDLITIL